MQTRVLEPERYAATVAEALVERIAAQPQIRLCLATGSTPRPVYAELVRAFKDGRFDPSVLQLTLLDEFGGLDTDDPGRCAAMLERDLLHGLGLGLRDVEHFDPDAFDPGAELERFRDAVKAGFDLCILGLGLNGHLGMNEPGSDRDAATRRVELHPTTSANSAQYGVRRAPTWGVTIGLRELLTSHEVWLLATGAHKAEIVAAMLEGEISNDLPATLLRDHPNSTAWLDEAASSALSSRPSAQP